MKAMILWSCSVLFVVSAQAGQAEKLACRATGKIQTVQTVIVEPTELEGQICAISSDQKGQLTFFVSNGSVQDERILVATRKVPLDGEYSVYLTRSRDAAGKPAYRLEEYFVCDENDIEFCHGSNRKEPKLQKTETGIQCKAVHS